MPITLCPKERDGGYAPPDVLRHIPSAISPVRLKDWNRYDGRVSAMLFSGLTSSSGDYSSFTGGTVFRGTGIPTLSTTKTVHGTILHLELFWSSLYFSAKAYYFSVYRPPSLFNRAPLIGMTHCKRISHPLLPPSTPIHNQ